MIKNYIYIDGWFLQEPLRGIGKYIQNILIYIPIPNENIEYILLVPNQEIDISKFPEHLTIKVIPCKLIFLWYEINIPIILRQKNSFIFFPAGICGVINSIKNKKVFATIHDISALLSFDLSPLSFNFRQIIGRLYRYFAFYKLVKQSIIIFTVSQTSKIDIRAYLKSKNIKSPNIFVVPNAPGIQEFKPKKKNKSFLCITGNSPQKNHKIIFKSLQYLEKDTLKGWDLYLVGLDKGRIFHHSSGVRIIIKKYLNSKEIKKLFIQSYCLIFPSLYESFGVPLLDGIKTRCYIIASKQGASSEICGKNAMYFNPFSPEDLSENILKVILKYPYEPLIDNDNLAFKQTWEKTSKDIFKNIENSK